MYFLFIIHFCFSQSVFQTILYGSTETLGYYYLDLYVGTPLVRQTVIVDTGSSLTAFPCTGCSYCGEHMDSYFDYTHSSTFKKLDCTSGVTCSSCNNGVCEYHQTYAEGSSIFGMLVEDILAFEPGIDQDYLVNNVFGCHIRETNLFKSQKADGIMGLARKKNNINSLIDTLYETQRIDSNSFSLCLGKENGLITVGGFNSSLHLSSMNWTNMYDEVYYSVKLARVYVDYHQIPIQAGDLPKIYTTGTVIDSGTTFTYLVTEIYTKVVGYFNQFCQIPGNCGGEPVRVYGEPQRCFEFDHKTNIEVFWNSFPVLRVVFENEAQVNWLPENYLFAWPDTPNYYCIGIYSNFEGGNILGGTFMRGNDVFFDRSEQKIGLAAASCSDGINTNRSLGDYKVDYKAGVFPQVTVFGVLVVSCCLMAIINLTVWGISRRKRESQVLE